MRQSSDCVSVLQVEPARDHGCSLRVNGLLADSAHNDSQAVALAGTGRKALKRVIDLLLLAIIVPVSLPVVLLICLAIKLTSPGPVFYAQERIGFRGQRFKMWKFRSMVTNADQLLGQYLRDNDCMQKQWERDHKLTDDPRVTSIGRLLRSSSLDELPQFWNVLVGDMSLVGPRPIVDHPDFDARYVVQHPAVFQMYKATRPGITGMWQISGRNRTTYARRIELDEYYLSNWSLSLDLVILIHTARTVLFREGAV